MIRISAPPWAKIHFMLALLLLAFVMQTSTSSAPATVDTKYLALKPSASADAVGPGVRFTLLLDVVPKPNIHVYAPGQPDYMPISLTLDIDGGIPGRGRRAVPEAAGAVLQAA